MKRIVIIGILTSLILLNGCSLSFGTETDDLMTADSYADYRSDMEQELERADSYKGAGQNSTESSGLLDATELEGEWASVEDPNYTIFFRGRIKKDFYQNDEISQGIYNIFNKDISTDSGKRKYLSVMVDGEDFEYEILKLDDRNLELIYIPKGNILKYKKLK